VSQIDPVFFSVYVVPTCWNAGVWSTVDWVQIFDRWTNCFHSGLFWTIFRRLLGAPFGDKNLHHSRVVSHPYGVSGDQTHVIALQICYKTKNILGKR